MTQAAISLISGPLAFCDLDDVLYELTLAVDASGIGSAPMAFPGPLPNASWFSSINAFVEAVNAVTAFDAVSLVGQPQGPGSLVAILNGIIFQINAFDGGGGYTARAVHFDGSASLARGARLPTGNFAKALLSYWVKQSPGGNLVWFSFPGSASGGNGMVNIAQNGQPTFSFGTGGGQNVSTDGAPIDISDGAWHHVLLSLDWTQTSLGDVIQVAVDGVNLSLTVTGTAGSHVVDIETEDDLIFGSDGYGDTVTADYAQVYWAEDALDLSVSSNVEFFIVGGKPVDVLTSGAPAPLILFDGDATGFVANQGSGGAFTLTGALTDASTSPSG